MALEGESCEREVQKWAVNNYFFLLEKVNQVKLLKRSAKLLLVWLTFFPNVTCITILTPWLPFSPFMLKSAMGQPTLKFAAGKEWNNFPKELQA